MAVYKDKKRGTWYTSFPYVDWTGKRCRKLKRGFLTKKEAQNWENHFKLQKANSLDMTFEDFYGIYEADVKPKIRYNTWCTKEHIIKTKILPYFKDLSMRDITPRDIIKWQNIMRESINNKGKEYTGTYLKTVQAQLSSKKMFYSNSTITNQFCLEIICCRVYSSFDYLIYPYYPAYIG